MFSLFFLAPSAAPFAETLAIISQKEKYDFAGYVAYLEDETRALELPHVINAKGWRHSDDNVLNFGITPSAYWLRLTIEDISFDRDWLIEFEFPTIDYIEAFFLKEGSLVNSGKTGARLPFSSRDIKHRNFVFKVPASTDQIYFRLESNLSVVVKGTLLTDEAWQRKDSRDQLLFGIFFGTLAAMILYHLIIYFTLFDSSYLYYVLFMLSYLLFITSEYGLISQFLLPRHPLLADKASIFFMIFSWLFIFLFARAFLKLKSFSVSIDKLVLFAAWFSALFFFIIFISDMVVFERMIGLMTAIFCSILIASILFVPWKTYRPVRLFFIAWIVFIAAGILSTSEYIGYIKGTFFMQVGLKAGFVLQSFLLSLGLRDRMKQLRMEKEAEQSKSLQSQLRSQRLDLDLLKKTIQPHFLLNSLTSLRGWFRERPEKALLLLDALTKELRPVLDWRDRSRVLLKEEIDLCRSHLTVMGLRYEREYRLTTEGAQGDEPVPPLIFHTMIENAFTHNDPIALTRFILKKERTPRSVLYRFKVDQEFKPVRTSQITVERTGMKYIRARLSETFGSRWLLEYGPAENGWEYLIEITDEDIDR